jgi:hypothetical protein
MAEADIPAGDPLIKNSLASAPSPFELWAADNQYDIAPAALPAPDRVYADRETQAAFDAWNAGAQNLARMLTESTLETEWLREKILQLAMVA